MCSHHSMSSSWSQSISSCSFFCMASLPCTSFFFFNDTATTEIYTLSLHDALPISSRRRKLRACLFSYPLLWRHFLMLHFRSEEHTSELQSHLNLVCRLLLEKKKTKTPAPLLRSNRPHVFPIRRRTTSVNPHTPLLP